MDVHTLTVDGAGTTRIDCPILGAGTDAIIKAGTGTLMFGNNAANNYEGTTIINDGTLLVNGTHTGGGLYTVHGDGTLGGTGTIHSAIDVLGTLAPGASVGELTVGGDLTLDGASLLIDLWGDGGAGVFGTGHDLLSFTSGQLFLDDSPQIAVDLNGFDPAFGNSYTIVDGFENELTGGFDPTVLVQNEPPAWGGKSFQIDYHYNSPGSIALTVVPEPGAWLLALIAAVCGLLVRRRR